MMEADRAGIYCGDKETRSAVESTTTGGPNHVWDHRYCEACERAFTVEWVESVRDRERKRAGEEVRPRDVWVVNDKREVVEGVPGCCEDTYTTRCIQLGCEGWRLHSSKLQAREAGGSRIASALIKNGRSVPDMPQFWKCTECGVITPDHRHGEKFLTKEMVKKALEELEAEPDEGPRKLRSTFSVGSDVMAVHGVDLEKELVDAFARQDGD